MAKSIVIVSDLSGETGAKTHRLALDNIVYEVDLTDAEFADLAASFGHFTAIARREVTGRPLGRRATGGAPTHRSRSAVADIKAWGRNNGWQVPERGRLPKALVAAYQAAIGQLDAT